MSEQSIRPPFLDASVPPEYPYSDTHDLRTGPDLHPALRGLVPFIGVWRGRGSGEYPTIESFQYAQEIRIAHDGRPFVSYEARAWLVDDAGEAIRPAAREVGWWRVMMGEDGPTDEIEALFCLPTGIMELHLGVLDGTKLRMATARVLRTTTAKDVTGGQRLYGIVDRDLLYAQDLEAVGQPLQPHLAAKLTRVGG